MKNLLKKCFIKLTIKANSKNFKNYSIEILYMTKKQKF